MSMAPAAEPMLLTENTVNHDSRRILTAEAQKQGVGQNIRFVEQLIHESAAAKQILASDNEEAQALREKALASLDKAKLAEQQGDAQAVADALHEAKQAIFQAMRLVGKKVVKDNRREQYEKRRSSTTTLLEAHQRISQEKGVDSAAAEVEAYAQKTMQEAQALYEDNKFAQALERMNIAYLSVKLSITKLRSGETLVRSLHFETRQDEYRYELDRNDTHKMLVEVVLKEKLADPRLGKLIAIPMKQADKLRTEAEQQAQGGDYESAIKTLEQSTKQIIRAIRAAGIYIPG
jgi:hypothetical protein